MNSFKTYLLLLFTLILTATLFISCSDNDKKARSIPFPEKFHGTWVKTGISGAQQSELEVDTLIIDINRNTFEVRGYLDTDQEFAFKFVLIEQIEQIEQNDDDGTFLLKNTEIVGESGKWERGDGSEEIGYKLVGDKITFTIFDVQDPIEMTRTEFTQLDGALIGTWEAEIGDNTIIFEGKTFINIGEEGNVPFRYSGTWDASEEKRGDKSIGILRTITTYSDDEDGEYDGLSFGGASPYELDGDNLKITYPGGFVTFERVINP